MKNFNLKKFVDLCKKPILIASAAIFAAFMVTIIVVSCLPHANKYSYKESIAGVTVEMTMTFKGDTATQKMSVSMAGMEPEVETYEYKYRIEGGKLYLIDADGTEEYSGLINVYRLKSDDPSGPNIAIECVPAVNFRTSAIIFIVLSGVVLAGCITLRELDKRGKIKYEQAKVEDAKVQPEEKTEE